MRVVVCAKVIPGAAAPRRIDPATFRLVRDGDTVINPHDLRALEEALRLRERGIASEVVVLSMGPPEVERALREALAMGADRATLVSDDRAAGSDLVATSRVLARALSAERPGLVLFGQQSADSGGALLWAAVAEHLELPVLSKAVALELNGERVRVRRQTEYGYDVLEAPVPCVVAVSSGINEPRYAPLRERIAAKAKVCMLVSLADLGLGPADGGEEGSRSEVVALTVPAAERLTEWVDDSEAAPRLIVERLVALGLV